MILRSSPKALRYGIVVFLGFCIDFTMSMALFQLFSLPLQLCAIAGFAAALISNYILFEHWAFRRETSGVSVLRFAQTSLTALGAMTVRIALITFLDLFLGKTSLEAAVTLLASASASFLLNYFVLQRVFQAAAVVQEGSV